MVTQPVDFDPLIDQRPARFVVGIDLGTTNSAAAYVDTDVSAWRVNVLPIPQLVAPAVVEDRETLPSFHYEASAGEAAGGALRLPWSREDPEYSVGLWAREQGTKVPGRLISSAKSWLCHGGVDRTAPLLPWQGAADVTRLSPVEVSARILRHVRAAWDHRFPDSPLHEQDVVLTLPASFDEVARELTVRAARSAGLPRVVLVEEPQAAFYAWVYNHRADWASRVAPGQTILVCDIGGGTTDFTLIRVRASQSADDQRVQFHRVAVGNHLILGGDNLDLALARYLEKQITRGDKLPATQWDVLVRRCRRVKEQMLGPDAPDRLTVQLPAPGTRLIGGGARAEVERDAVRQTLLDGFLPWVKLEEKPRLQRSGFQEFGLPFATDPAITRYLAEFLLTHREQAGGPGETHSARPDIVLFNGGFFASPVLRQRLIDVLAGWFQTPGAESWTPRVLDNDRLDLAVARGAAYYGMVRRGEGVRITANLARSYYAQIESDTPQAVCLMPGSTEPGEDVEVPERVFKLLISQPVEFPLLVSSTRLTDRPGELVAIDPEQMRPLPPIRTVLRTQRRRETGTIPVRLHARLTEIGTIDLWCAQIDSERTWRLQFDVRSATQTDREARVSTGDAEGVLDESVWDRCRSLLESVFGDRAEQAPDRLMRRLADVLQTPRGRWPTPLLRRIWETLMELEAGRRRSPVCEARWLNLLGFALRPGYGLAVDDWRVAETWRHVQGKLVHHAPAVRSEATVLWRRIAGGLSKGQQQALADPLFAAARNLQRRYTKGGRGEDISIPTNELVEVWRLLGSLELLDVPRKIELGDILVALLPKRKLEKTRAAAIWTLGRLGQRVPVYGPLNTVVPGQVAERWLEAMLRFARSESIGPASIMQIARRTDDRYRDLSEPRRKEAVMWLEDRNAEVHLIELVRQGGQLDAGEQQQIFGESLPIGLRLE